jgi:hypothetical protein
MRRSLAQPCVDKQRKKEALLFVEQKTAKNFFYWAVLVSAPRSKRIKIFAPLF